MNSPRTDSTNVAVCTYVERSVRVGRESCSFLPQFSANDFIVPRKALFSRENGHSVPVAQLDRASASGAEGYRFEPCRGYFYYSGAGGEK